MLFHIIGRPAAAGGRMTIGASDMNRNRQVVADGGLKDRPIATASQRFVGSRQKKYLRKIRVAASRVDFGNGAPDVFLRDKHRSSQAGFLLHPALDLPGIHGSRQRDAKIKVSLTPGVPAQWNQHPDLDAILIE